MADGLRKNDPNREILDSEKSDRTPGFLGGTGSGDVLGGLYKGASQKAKKANNAKNVFGGAEAGAADQDEDSQEGGFYRGGGGVLGARKNEESGGGLYRAGVVQGGGKKKGNGKGKGKGFFSRGKPAILTGLILSIFGIGAVSFTSISSELISWKENIASMFGQNSAVINRRSNFLFRKLLSTNDSVTSASGKKFKIGAKLSKKLADENIDYVETTDANGKKLKLLVFEDTDGKVIPIVASDADVSRANSLTGKVIEVGDGKQVKITESSMTLSEAKNVNKGFSKNFDTATITLTGKIAGWFDNMTDSLLERIIGDGARNQTDIDDPDKEKVDDMLLNNKSEGLDDTEMKVTNGEEDDGEGGTKPRQADASDSFDDGSGKMVTYGEVESASGKIKTDSPSKTSVASSLSNRARKVAMLTSTVACGFLKGIGAISTAIGAIQTINVINYASKYLEIADKIKAGEGDEVANIALNNLSTPVTTNAYTLEGDEVTTTGATNASAGFNAVFSSKNVLDEDDPSVLMSNRELASKNAIRSLSGGGIFADVASAVASFGGGIAAFRICNGVQAVVGLIDGISDIAAFFTMGAAKAIKEIIKGAVQGLALAGAMALISAVISAITPTVASWFAGKLSNAFLGENGGAALLSGSQNLLGSNLQMSTGRYATKENAIEVFALTNSVEREWAEYERSTKSPFDTTSKYTFLGSLYNSMLPIVRQSSGGMITSTVSSVANLAKSSAVALVSPSVKAANEVDDFAISLAKDESCGYLYSVGVAGDYMCNKYSGAYVNELSNMDPETNEQVMKDYGSFEGEDSDGNPKIKDGSDYAKYVVACVANDAQPGTMSAAVEGYIEQATTTDSAVANGLINVGMNFVPFSGFLDAIDAGEQEANFVWNSGQACTGKTDDTGLNEKVKHFSMYNLDQRVLYDMGAIESNSTVAFLEDYYEKNPLDNSFEGQIARFSGMSKEEVSDTLALMEYYQFLANYDPSERYAFGAPVVEEDNTLLFDNDNTVAADAVLLNVISFADVRNRSYAV